MKILNFSCVPFSKHFADWLSNCINIAVSDAEEINKNYLHLFKDRIKREWLQSRWYLGHKKILSSGTKVILKQQKKTNLHFY
jgi:hypothetical protein